MIHIAIFSMGSTIDGNHPRIGKLNGGAPFCAKSDQQPITGFTLIEVKSFDSGCLTEQSAGVVQVHDGEKQRNTEEEIENTLVDFTVPRTNRAKKRIRISAHYFSGRSTRVNYPDPLSTSGSHLPQVQSSTLRQ